MSATVARTGVQGVLRYNARPISLNASYGHHRHKRTAHVREWRDTFAMLARAQGHHRLGVQAIEVEVRCGMSGRLQDIGNCYVSAKAAIDGLVLAGVIVDDGGEHLRKLTFLPPERVKPSEPDWLALWWTAVCPAGGQP